jgi:aryl-alcohol dehydrogenase-like predicted oxidoreductase
VEYKKLGKTDLSVSRIGFGCWAIGGHGYGRVDDKESIRAIETAIELGINFFDTANVYGFGHSEKLLSKALGRSRHDVVIATKGGVKWDDGGNSFRDCSAKAIVESLEGSLRRLKIDCIPLYQIHWPDEKTPISETLEALERCREAGKIKHVGCCNFPLELIRKARKSCELVSTQSLFNLSHRDNEATLGDCSSSMRMSVFVYGVLARGLFSGKYDSNSKFGEDDTRAKDKDFSGEDLRRNLNIVEALKVLAEKHNKSPAQVAIRWVLDLPFVTCALVGAKTAVQVKENCGSVGWMLDESERQSLRLE